MKTEADSRALAQSIVSIGNASGVKTVALITDMDKPLGRAVGNANEVIECIEVLKGGGPADLIEVTLALTARLLVLGGVATDLADADRRARAAIRSGAALDRWRQIIEVQGGNPRVVDDVSLLPHVENRYVLKASRDGYVSRIDAELVGRASGVLGAGRDRVVDPVDHAVGIMVLAKPGDAVRRGDPIFELEYRDRGRLERALAFAGLAVAIQDSPPRPRPLIVSEVQ
jgi:thymidine phosphorylase